MALCSCQTMEFGDVAPETKGSALGDVKIGKQNKDFFIIPGAPITPDQMTGKSPVPPQNIVVFKTRERQPLYRAAHVAGTPARVVGRAYNYVVEAIVKLTFGWFKKKEPKAPVTAPVIYPANLLPAEPFANARSLGAPTGPSTAHVWNTPQIHRNGG